MNIREHIEQLSVDRRRLLARWLEQADGGAGTNASVDPLAGGRFQLVAYVRADETSFDDAELRRGLAAQLPEHMVPSTFVRMDAFPTLPNGKVDIQALPAAQQAASPADESITAPRNDVEQALLVIWTELFGTHRISVTDNFFELGGDSIVSIQLVSLARDAGLSLDVGDVVESPTIAELARRATASKQQAEDTFRSGPVPLTPIQHWFFNLDLAAPQHWNQSAMYELPTATDPVALSTALSGCIARYDALRAQFTQTSGRWSQFIIDPSDVAEELLKVVDLRSLPPADHKSTIEREVADAQSSFDLSAAPLVRAVYFTQHDDKPPLFLLVIHHLIVDAVSWRVLIGDLEAGYARLVGGSEPDGGSPPTTFASWSGELVDAAESSELVAKLDDWMDPIDDVLVDIPRDFPGSTAGDEASAAVVSRSLDQRLTGALLHEVHTAYNTRPIDFLITALLMAVRGWTGASSLRLGVEGHGRVAPLSRGDLTSTVGWFTSFYPHNLRLSPAGGPATHLREVKEQLRRVTDGGISYGILRYLSSNEDVRTRLSNVRDPEVLFNYGGILDIGGREHMFGQVESSQPSARSGRNRRSHLLEVNSLIVADQLQLHWSYSRSAHKGTTIERLAAAYHTSLTELIEHCLAPAAGGFTPSDFPEVDMSQDELDRFLDGLTEE